MFVAPRPYGQRYGRRHPCLARHEDRAGRQEIRGGKHGHAAHPICLHSPRLLCFKACLWFFRFMTCFAPWQPNLAQTAQTERLKTGQFLESWTILSNLFLARVCLLPRGLALSHSLPRDMLQWNKTRKRGPVLVCCNKKGLRKLQAFRHVATVCQQSKCQKRRSTSSIERASSLPDLASVLW